MCVQALLTCLGHAAAQGTQLELEEALVVGRDVNLQTYHRPHHVGLGDDPVPELAPGLVGLGAGVVVGVATDAAPPGVLVELPLRPATEELVVVVVDWVHKTESPH